MKNSSKLPSSRGNEYSEFQSVQSFCTVRQYIIRVQKRIVSGHMMILL